MKVFKRAHRFYRQPLVICCLLLLSAMFDAAARAAPGEERAREAEKVIATAGDVVVGVCVASGRISVYGGDRNEVRVTSEEEAEIELRGVGTNNQSDRASRVEVRVADGAVGDQKSLRDCAAFSDLTVMVPRGASVQLRTEDGDVTVTGVSAARVEAMNGNVALRDISGAVEITTVSGDVELASCRGALRLRTISGDIDGQDLRPSDQDRDLEAHSVSGDINLEEVAHRQLEIVTVSGNASIDTLLLPRGSRYNIKSTTGDVTLTMPPDTSFQLIAKAVRGEVINDFGVRQTKQGGAAAKRPPGVHGLGDAALTIYSYSGTIHLRRK